MMALSLALFSVSSFTPRAAARWRATRGGAWMSSVPAEASVALAERSSSPEPKLFTALRKETSQRWPG